MTMAQRESSFANAYTTLQTLLMCAHSRQETELTQAVLLRHVALSSNRTICGVQI